MCYLTYPSQQPTEKILPMPTAGTGQGWHFTDLAKSKAVPFTPVLRCPLPINSQCSAFRARCFVCIMSLNPLNHPRYEVQMIILIIEMKQLGLEKVLELWCEPWLSSFRVQVLSHWAKFQIYFKKIKSWRWDEKGGLAWDGERLERPGRQYRLTGYMVLVQCH